MAVSTSLKSGPLMLLSLFLTAFGLELWLFRDIWQNYYPANDDIALILHSTDFGNESLVDRVHSWFTEGFSNYWYVFPEWSEPHTNYLRPGVNLSFLLLYALFGSWWQGYLIACYLLYALVLVLMVDLAARTYGLRGRVLVLVSIGLATTPSAWLNGELFFNPTFAFDALITAMIVCAFRAYLARNHGLLTVILALAVFTKETALAAAAAAITGVLLHSLPLLDPRRASLLVSADDAAAAETPLQEFVRGLAIAAMIALPLLVWSTLRWLAFGDQVGVAVASTGVESPVLHYIRQVLEWPFNAGMINGDAVGALHRRDLLAVPPGFYAQVLANATFFAIIVIVLAQRWRAIQQVPASAPPIAADPTHLLDTSLWMFWLGLLLVLTAVTPRIGQAAPVFAACLLGALWQWSPVRGIRRAAMLLLVTVALTNVATSVRLLNGGFIETNAERSLNEAALVGLLREQAASGRQLLIVNDFSSRYVSNDDLRLFAGIPGSLTRLNSIEYRDDSLSDRRPSAGYPTDAVRIQRDGDAIVVDVALPDYLRFKFEDVRDGRLLGFRDGDTLTSKACRYRFPGLNAAPPQPIDFGRTMQLRCTIDGDFRVIYYDPAERRYRVADPG